MNRFSPSLRTLLVLLSLVVIALPGLTACSSKKKAPEARLQKAEAEWDCSPESNRPHVACSANASAAFDPKGKLWVAWSQNGRVYVSQSDNYGHNYGRAVAVNANPESIEDHGEAKPRIVANKSGAIYVAWTQSAGGHIRFSRSLDSGRTFTEPQTVSDTGSINKLSTLVVNNRDYIFIVWIRGSGENASLHYALSTNGGRQFRPEISLDGHTSDCNRVSLRPDTKQLPVVLWRQQDNVLMNHFSAKDRPGSIETIGDVGSSEKCDGPALSILPKAGYFAAWASHNESQKGVYFTSSYDQHGQNFSTPRLFRQSGSTSGVDILADERSVFMAWKQAEGDKTYLMIQYSMDGGATWSNAKQLAESKGETNRPTLLNNSGRHFVAWHTHDEGLRLISVTD